MHSSLISVLTRHFEAAAAPCPPANPFELATPGKVFDRLPDPRRVRGRRYRLGSLLGLCLVTVLGGARSLAQIARFAADAAPAVHDHAVTSLFPEQAGTHHYRSRPGHALALLKTTS
ncbi:transposase family protein [Streptomyces griseoflavus]|uniref:H repeat-associated protein N-terminal domain-containing protein n=1 Tax=Streptomyces griseoflavus Tu4000 TaxID=467200 RepID=D9XPL4_9ACTN|nr:transposase family protein [Streptomyces griseoflavus]EFL38588.1 hypothetical protein SSRG_01392 [Streptomyces griseoflavus Tu4000]